MKKFLIIVCLALSSCGCSSNDAKATYEVKFKDGSVVKYEGSYSSHSNYYVKITDGGNCLFVNIDAIQYVEKIQ